ncbi:MAG: KxYKxGKxW signal peptide domain-containing protein [Candidatus Thorarchaeota archaeon]
MKSGKSWVRLAISTVI